jgi:hypothetical protein
MSEPDTFDSIEEARDIADVPAIEVINTVAVHLLSAAAVKLGLADDPESQLDLDEARKLIISLAGLVTAAAPEIGDQRARFSWRSARPPGFLMPPARAPARNTLARSISSCQNQSARTSARGSGRRHPRRGTPRPRWQQP